MITKKMRFYLTLLQERKTFLQLVKQFTNYYVFMFFTIMFILNTYNYIKFKFFNCFKFA